MTRVFLVVLAAVVAVLPAAAETFTGYQTVTLGPTATDWGPTPLTFNQFNPTLGTLDEVDWIFQGEVTGTSSVENLDGIRSIQLDLGATLNLYSGLSILASVTPIANNTFNAAPFDGTIDFGGTSGATYSNLSATLSANGTLLSGLAPYIGAGTFNTWKASAAGASVANGGGNFVSEFQTNGTTTAEVRYGYDQANPPSGPTPELAPGALMLLSLVGVIGFRRRRK